MGMFRGCTSLTVAPELPSTTLGGECYFEMFRNCNSLVVAPELPAQTLVRKCYANMFNNCNNLNSIRVGFTEWDSSETDNATNNWVAGVSSEGTFTCPDSLADTRGSSNIPTSWTRRSATGPLQFTAQQANSTVRLDKVGSPSATSLETSTDGSTWSDYTWSESTGATITLTNVGDRVYFRAKTQNEGFSVNNENYYNFVMSGKISAGGNINTLQKSDGDISTPLTYRGLFRNCTALTTAPELPATTIGNNYVYAQMFLGCSSLVLAPKLPATTLGNYCYMDMFLNCTSLVVAPALPAMTIQA